jgi:hypothetical protein
LDIRALEARISRDFCQIDAFADGDYDLYVETLFEYLKDARSNLWKYRNQNYGIRVQVAPDVLGEVGFLGSVRNVGRYLRYCTCTEDLTMFGITYTLEPNEYHGLVLDAAFKRKAGL